MDLEILEKIGLTKGESRVYITLAKIGLSSVGNIINNSKVSRSKIYDVLNRLITKGIVTSVTEGKIKRFNAVPPRQLKEFIDMQKEELENKEQKLNELIPKLQKISPSPETYAEILSGPRGIKAFFDMSNYNNPTNDELLVLGYSREASIYFHAYWRDHHKERIKRKIHGRVIYDYETWFLKERNKRKYVEQRYLPKGIKTPAFILVWADTVGTIVFTKEQKLCFMIKNKEVAKSYKDYFELLWKQSTKTGK